uniref:Ring finger protein 11 n=1 Tax=Oncorhynchus tshawytscha TaxID=74940 RepID=A0A8C8IAX8_ONCTS
MGNCLSSQGADDLSLLNESQEASVQGASTERVHAPVYHPTPSQTCLASQLTEEEQVRIAQRIGLIHHLPRGIFDPGSEPSDKKVKECAICMNDFEYGDPIRFLPCLSFTCPSCMEPVDAALLSSYETN